MWRSLGCFGSMKQTVAGRHRIQGNDLKVIVKFYVSFKGASKDSDRASREAPTPSSASEQYHISIRMYRNYTASGSSQPTSRPWINNVRAIVYRHIQLKSISVAVGISCMTVSDLA